MADSGALRLDQQMQSQDALILGYYNRNDGVFWWIGLAVALAVLAGAFFLQMPEVKASFKEEEKKNVVIVRKYVPPPPKIQKRQVQQQEIKKKLPVPDPDPDEPEPIVEPEPEIEEVIIPPDVEIMIGEPEPPPPSGPLLAGVGDVTNPVKIDEAAVKPTYPELARVARVEGDVILQAIIKADGSVGDLEVLRCTRPSMGFEEAAIEAVRQWRYEPALQNGKPVEVYFTIFVEFKLH